MEGSHSAGHHTYKELLGPWRSKTNFAEKIMGGKVQDREKGTKRQAPPRSGTYPCMGKKKSSKGGKKAMKINKKLLTKLGKRKRTGSRRSPTQPKRNKKILFDHGTMGLGKAKIHLELSLTRHMMGNKKDLWRLSSSKKRTREKCRLAAKWDRDLAVNNI